MDMHKSHKRRIRIEGKLDSVDGYMLTVHDANTGESINNIVRIEVLLDVEHENRAVVTYHEKNEQGKLVVGKDRKPVEKTITVHDPDLSNVTAFAISEDLSE